MRGIGSKNPFIYSPLKLVTMKTDRMKTYYEWDYVTVNEHGDIIDHNHCDKLSKYSKDNSEGTELVLVRDTGDDANGLNERYWAYVTDGKLPEYFTDSLGEPINIKVPQRFHKELDKYNKP